MKKIMLICFILIFFICGLNITSKAQSDTSGEAGANIILGLIEDELLQESAQELAQIYKDLIKAARETGATKSIIPLVNSIRRNSQAILRAAQHMPTERCGSTFKRGNFNFERSIVRLEKLQQRLCSNVGSTTSARTFYPMAKHCKSPFDLKCVCSHPEHKKEPRCASYSMAGSTMSGSGIDDGSGISSPGKEEPKCLSDEDFETTFDSLAGTLNEIVLVLIADNNNNGIPDACENNE